MGIDEKKTEELINILNHIDQESELLGYLTDLDENNTPMAFHTYFTSLPEVKKIKPSELMLRSGLDRSYFYQLMKGTRKPGRDNAILLCIAAGLDLTITQRILEKTNLGILYAKDRRDAVLVFCINNRLTVSDSQELLDRFGEKTLGKF